MAGAARQGGGIQLRKSILFNFSILVLTMAAVALGLLGRHHPVLVRYDAAVAFIVLVLVTRWYLSILPRSRLPDAVSEPALWLVAVTAVVFTFGLPVAFVVLARSGWSVSAVLPFISQVSSGGRLLGDLEALLMYGVSLLVVVVPELLRALGRAAAATSLLVPGWLAGVASVMTAASILMLHFGGFAEADLRKTPMGVLSVVTFGVTVLLAPFYRFVAKECLQRGIAVVFDPTRWWSSGWAAFAEVIRLAPAAVKAVVDSMGARDSAAGSGEVGGEPGVSAGVGEPAEVLRDARGETA
jgi:hypothetical protein